MITLKPEFIESIWLSIYLSIMESRSTISTLFICLPICVIDRETEVKRSRDI